MKHNVKRFFSFLMAACLLIGLVPMSTGAEGTQADVQFVGHQLSLNDDLTMKFYVAMDEATAQNAVMHITVAGNTTTESVSSMTPGENGYLFTADLAAAQMTDDIILSVTVDGAEIAKKTYSVQDYAHYLLEGNYTAETKQMVKQMLNYGAKAQKYFDYNANDLADAGYEVEAADAVPAVTEEVAISGAVDGISFYGATLLFKSKVAIRYYFNAPNGVAGYTFEGHEAKEKDGRYYVEVADINPQDLNKNVELTVSDGTDAKLTVGYSPMMYIKRMFHKDSTTAALKNLLQAMYDYHLAAVAFTGVEEEEPVPTTTVYYWNKFDGQTVTAGDGSYDIKDSDGRSFADNNDAYRTVTENGNTFLEIQSAGSAASQALVWTNTGDTLPSVLEISMKMKVAEGVSFGKDQITLRYRRGDKNYVFAKMYEQSLTLPTGSGVTPVLTDWTDVKLVLDSVSGVCTYQVGEAEGTFTIDAAALGLQGFMFRAEANNGGLYIDDLRVIEVIPETSVSASVSWDDSNDDDGIRPDAVTLGLYNGETLIETVQVSDNNNWQFTFANLVKYDENHAVIAYAVQVEEVPAGYTVSEADGVITLSHAPTATWYYKNDFEGQEITVVNKTNMIADANGRTFTNNNNLYKIVELPDGNTVLELISEGSATSFLSIAGAPSMLTIKFRVRLAEETSFSGRVLELRYRDGKKPFAAFVDNNLDVTTSSNNNNYTYRSALSTEWTDVEMTLDTVNGKIYYNVNGTSGEMAGTFTSNGLTQIDFYSHTVHSGIYIDDLHIAKGIATTSVPVSVTWDDSDDGDGIRPSEITLSLFNGDTLVDTAKITAADNWQYTFTNVPKYDVNDDEIIYTVYADTIPAGYTADISGTTVTLSHVPTITWYYKNGFEGQTVTAGDKVYNIPDANGMNFVNNNDLFKTVVLPDGNTVLELISEGSATSFMSIADAPEALTIKFRVRLAEDASFSGRVLELRYRDGKKPFAAFCNNGFEMTTSAKVDNYYYSAALSTEWIDVEITIDAANGLISYNVNGQSGEMTVTAFALSQIDFYSHSAHSGIYIDDLSVFAGATNVAASVSWDDSNDDDGIRPDAVTLSLYNGNTLIKTAEVTAASGWKYAFSQLPQYDANGEQIVYTVQVDAIPVGYTAVVSGMTVTLSHVPAATWYYKNDFEGQTITAGDKVYEIADANGRVFTNNNDLYRTVTLEDGNTVMEMISTGSAVSYFKVADTKVITVKFRVCLKDDSTELINEALILRYRDNRGSTKYQVAATFGNNFDIRCDNSDKDFYDLRSPLSTQWLDVEVTINTADGTLSYCVGGNEGSMILGLSADTEEGVNPGITDDTVTLTQVEFFHTTDGAFEGLYIDDLQVFVPAE